MKISTKGRYGIRMMTEIAAADGALVKLRDIAAKQDISIKYLEQITALLVKAELLKGIRGAQGGYMLTRAPKDYTLAEILFVTEGSLSPVACLEGEINTCPRNKCCATLAIWKGLEQAISDYLNKYTLADVLVAVKS